MQKEKENWSSSSNTETMAASVLASSNHQIAEDEDFIDMEVLSSPSSSSSSSSSLNNNKILCYASISSPPQSKDFEFQMCSSVSSKDQSLATAATNYNYSPADELFYKGKLLPLHLPPRLLMVQNLLRDDSLLEETSAAASTIATNTPLDRSYNLSPPESCRVSSEINPDEYFFEWSSSSSSNEMRGFISDAKKHSWARKLKQIKKSSLGQKLKASRAYIKSLLSKSTCSSSDEAKAAACNAVEAEYMESPFGKIETGRCYSNSSNRGILKMMIDHQDVAGHRKSFSGAIQRHSPSTSTSSSGSSSLSSSFSFASVGFYNLHLLKRSSSANSEIECSIEGAIAHCKQSHSQSPHQQLLTSIKNVNEASKICSI